MSRQEVLCTPLGEMEDMIACLAIYEGNAKPKNTNKWTHDEALSLE